VIDGSTIEDLPFATFLLADIVERLGVDENIPQSIRLRDLPQSLEPGGIVSFTELIFASYISVLVVDAIPEILGSGWCFGSTRKTL
jgi:hypothetical protein